MSPRTINLTDPLYDYLLQVSLREPEILRRLREETAELPMAQMQIGPEQGQFMRLLAELIGSRRYLEVGTFTGYSALCVVFGMPDDGRALCCDVSEEYTAVAERYWQEAGVTGQIDLRLAPAVETLDNLIANGQENSFDFAFIDADKENYDNYYEQSLKLVRRGGLIAVDNVLWNGRVVDPDASDGDTEAIRALNSKLARDDRISLSLVPIGDGLTLARKR